MPFEVLTPARCQAQAPTRASSPVSGGDCEIHGEPEIDLMIVPWGP